MANVVDKESLFSLELVVEKLYIPHVECRFPAVAFRLLDFPTILVEHVEKELGDKIRRKISTDPYYNVPPQFSELKDKHGNFLMKKGKSCLFKMPVPSLKTHLCNTPLYVMIIDNFPRVSKLLGNCTVPLDGVMDLIVNDIKTLGNTVPSVHGDKGLYKIYSLMGKEIGYIILGYRLLSLGPGLIPHIPESAIAKRMSMENKNAVKKDIPKQIDAGVSKVDEDALMTTQDMGSMTDPEKHDVILQTLDTCDKEIHVALTEPIVKPKETEDKGVIAKELQTIATQTFRRTKPKSVAERNGLEVKNEVDDDNDNIITTNIAQPPPLFYNSEAEPARKTQRLYAYNDHDDMSSVYSDDSQNEEIMPLENKNEKEQKMKKPSIQHQNKENLQKQQYAQPAKITLINNQAVPAQLASQNRLTDNALFPVLTALMNEISKIQNPQILQHTVQQVQAVSQSQQQYKQVPKNMIQRDQSGDSVIPQKKVTVDQGKEDQNDLDATSFSRHKGRKSHKACAHPHDGVPRQKSWIRKVPELGVKKSKLTYGLTNTQRLRLAKVNPDWAKSVDKEDTDAKAQRLKQKQGIKNDEEFDTGNLSDTLTEVRRLAEKNLQDTLAEDSMLYGTKLSTLNSSRNSNRRKISPPRHKKKQRNRSKSPKSTGTKQRPKQKSEDEPQSKDSPSAAPKSTEEDQSDRDTPSLPSQRSIQVRIPSAQMYEGESDDSFSDLEDRQPARSGRFPGFHDDDGLLDSIDPLDNKLDHNSFELSKEDDLDQPLESTRNSKPSPPKSKLKFRSRYSPDDPSNIYNDDSFESADMSPRHDKVDIREESRPFQSTEDYSTHQFQSTDEPELQRLMSSGEKSELSDVMSSDRSGKSPIPVGGSINSARFQVLNPKASLQSPVPALRRSQIKLDGSVGRPSPTGTPRSQTSSRYPTPKPRKANQKRIEFKRESLNTESVSSYFPSDQENMNPSLESDNYSDDFSLSGRDELRKISDAKVIPGTKLGYTIH